MIIAIGSHVVALEPAMLNCDKSLMHCSFEDKNGSLVQKVELQQDGDAGASLLTVTHQ